LFFVFLPVLWFPNLAIPPQYLKKNYTNFQQIIPIIIIIIIICSQVAKPYTLPYIAIISFLNAKKLVLKP